jgi:hypothetical protein
VRVALDDWALYFITGVSSLNPELTLVVVAVQIRTVECPEPGR